MEIKVLGTGCAKCKTLFQTVEQAVAELQLQASVTKVEDIVEIMGFGVMSTPALVIDGKVVFSGKTPSLTEIKSLLILKK